MSNIYFDKNTVSVANSYSECKDSNYTISSMDQTFGKWLSAKRDAAGMTQEELATAAGLSSSYISALEREEKNTKDGKPRQPKPDKVDKIARALGVPIDEARDKAGYASKIKHTDILRDFEKVIDDRKDAVVEIIQAAIQANIKRGKNIDYLGDE